MRFFNPKEEVLDIQLTQHGKRLLSIGKLEPTYYAFYDREVLYDVSYSSGTEKQKESSDRIIYDTPRLRAQYNFTTLEKKPDANDKENTDGRFDPRGRVGGQPTGETKVPMQPAHEREYFASSCLGNASISNQYAPAWRAALLNGEFSSQACSGSKTAPWTRVPQLNSTLEYETVAYSPIAALSTYQEKIGAEGGDEDFVDSRLGGFMEYDDGSKIVVRKDYILLDLEEFNVDFKNENFDIEVYEIVDSSEEDVILNGAMMKRPKAQSLQQMYFKLGPMTALGDATMQDPMHDEHEVGDPNCVEYFLDIKVDREIDSEIMCKFKQSIKSRTFLDSLFDCPEEEGDAIRVDYGTVVEDPEECD